MMKNVAIATDSHSSITPEMAQTLGVAVLPMPFTIDGICYLEEETLTRAEFYAHQRRGEDAYQRRYGQAEGRADQKRPLRARTDARGIGPLLHYTLTAAISQPKIPAAARLP